MIYVSRKEHFNAAHKLFNPAWSVEKNEEVFGPCANENWHGHNYELVVTVAGEINPETGFVVDMKALSDLIKAEVLEKVDHRNFNVDVPFMQGKLASCENIIVEFWDILAAKVKEISNDNAVLHKITLHETKIILSNTPAPTNEVLRCCWRTIR